MSTISTGIKDKADRLIADDQVHRISLTDFDVEGDHGTYRVVVVNPDELSGACACKRWTETHQPCSHLYAASAVVLADVDRFEGDKSRWQQAYDDQPADPFEGL